jgi:hypothetical protein
LLIPIKFVLTLQAPQQVHLAVTTNVDEMLVQWVTRANDPSVVQYGLLTGSYPHAANGTTATYSVGLDGTFILFIIIFCGVPCSWLGWTGWVHTVLLTGLSTNTKYYYIVGSPDNWSEEFYFTSAPKYVSSFCFF